MTSTVPTTTFSPLLQREELELETKNFSHGTGEKNAISVENLFPYVIGHSLSVMSGVISMIGLRTPYLRSSGEWLALD
jgi:hypothetical protein